ncbi:hypothetical protein [Streptomyces agglomeratus]|uniref:hypothetical protein n=1 Tax=Streptomyces agglomeratus TaxID=285458 RepID=UPI0008541F94|nr:hypothetical protein [Streptomyces agglomeratus]OEJ52008.1 hypothetical protein BGK72_15735 [Streptomyces agglomeratus]
MTDPADPVLLFDEDGRMFIMHDPALASELIESVDEFFEGYDGQARPVRAYGEPGEVGLALVTTEAQGDELRARVERYYAVFAVRHPTRIPPQESELVAFVRAVAEDWIEE